MFFFFNDTAPTEIYTLSLHDALPDLPGRARASFSSQRRSRRRRGLRARRAPAERLRHAARREPSARSEEHTSELQSRFDLVCRLLLEKKKKIYNNHEHTNIQIHKLSS